MSMNNTPSAERVHIGIFGRRNAGKSSVINAMTGQDLAIVSDVKGTTTDPVLKAMELLPLGPVVMIDTPGLDDEGELGALRVQKAYQILNKTDIAVLVMDATLGMTPEDEAILKRIQAKEIPFLLVFNKTDLLTSDTQIQNTDGYRVTSAPNTSITALRRQTAEKYGIQEDLIFFVSASDMDHIYELKEKIASLAPSDDNDHRIGADPDPPRRFCCACRSDR